MRSARRAGSQAADGGDSEQQRRHADERHRVERAHAVEQEREEAREAEGEGKPEPGAQPGELQPAPDDERHHVLARAPSATRTPISRVRSETA